MKIAIGDVIVQVSSKSGKLQLIFSSWDNEFSRNVYHYYLNKQPIMSLNLIGNFILQSLLGTNIQSLITTLRHNSQVISEGKA